jgi:ADP-ribosylation factor 2-binding protein
MAEFLKMLNSRDQEELQGEIFELLASLGDFQIFKECMLDFKSSQNGNIVDLSDLLEIKPS